MSLRLRMVTVLALGTALFLVGTAALRSRLAQGEAELSSRAASEFAVSMATKELERGVQRTIDRLRGWVERTTDATAARAGGDLDARRFWERLLQAASLGPEETLALADPAGVLLAADGAWATRVERFSELVDGRMLVGRSGRDGMRAGPLSAGSTPLVGVSFTVPASLMGHGPDADAVPGTAYRALLVTTVALGEAAQATADGRVELIDLATDSLPPALTALSPGALRSGELQVVRAEDDFVAVRAVVDPSERASFLLASRVPVASGGAVPKHLRAPLLWEALTALFVGALAVGVLGRWVVRPLGEMERQARRLARSEHGNLSFHSPEHGQVRALADALDDMLGKIQADRSEYVRSARIAGMSDVSMAVVHNAGNVLNSINVSTQYVAKEIAGLGVSDIRSLVTELEEHRENLADYVANDPNGRFMIPFLAAMAEALDDLRTRCLVELESVDHGIEHVIDLIRSQERYAIGASVVEEARIPDVVNMAFNIAALSNERSGRIHVERSYAKLPKVRIDRHKLTSILINVISNAIEALVPDEVSAPRLELSVYSMSQDRFVIEITDTGVGIAPENLDKIFNSSFTTKVESSGHGLHTTANLCNEMGIAIGAVSEGAMCGTTIKLRVPYVPPVDEETVLEGVGAVLPSPSASADGPATLHQPPPGLRGRA